MTRSDSLANTPWKRRFFAIWTGQAFSLLGSQLVQFALVWWLTSTTGSALVLATATLFAILPQVFISPVAGALVDRWNRRLVMIVADTLVAVTTVGLVVLAASGNLQTWHVYAAMLLRSAFGAFHFPAFAASTSLMVPDEQLARINGLNEGLRGLMGIAAPPLGALLLSLAPLHSVLAVDIITATLAVVPLLFIAVPQPEKGGVSEHPNPFKAVATDMLEGFRYVRAWPGLLMLMFVAMALNLVLAPSMSFAPLMVTEHFDGGAVELGWLESALGVGVIAGGLALGMWGGFKRRILTSLAGILILSLGVTLMGFAPAAMLWVGIAAMFIMGFGSPMANGPIFAILQSTVRPEMQGRVMSLLNSGASAMMPVGLIIAGPLADQFGVRTLYVAGGVLCALIAITCTLVRPLMNIEQNAAPASPLPAALAPEAAGCE
jgi:DHA3 family macrolide efflux protein-like MFS transporter